MKKKNFFQNWVNYLEKKWLLSILVKSSVTDYNRITVMRISTFLFIALLSHGMVWGQLFQQQFNTNLAAFNSSYTPDATYINTTSPSNSQLTYLASAGAGVTISVANNKLTLARTANQWNIARSVSFSGPPTTLMVGFDYATTGASAATTTAVVFGFGSGTTGYTNSTTVPTAAESFARLSFNCTATSGQFTTRYLHTSSGGTNGSTYSGTKRILYVLNNSGSALSYRAPDGSNESLASGAFDVWVGTTKDFDDIAQTTTSVAMSKFKAYSSSGNQTVTFGNMLMDPIPTTPTVGVSSANSASGFQANWTAVSGVTGYRLDVATDIAFSSMVSGYNNLYISGQATNSYSVTGLSENTTYYYRVRAVSQYTVDEFASGNSTTQSAVTASPTITTPDPSSLTAFSTTTGSASASQTFTVGGSNLIASLVVTAPDDFEVRESGTGVFGPSVSFTPSEGTVSLNTIEVRIKSTATPGSPSGNVVCSSTGAISQNVAVSGTVGEAAGPVIFVGSLSSFGYHAINSISTEKTFTVSGTNLTGGIVIAPPANFEISSTSGSGFIANPGTISLSPTEGAVSETTLYVRFAPTAVQSYTGNIVFNSTDATQKEIAVSGIGSYPEPTNYPADLIATTNSFNQITVSWTDVSAGAQLPDGYIIKAAIHPDNPSAPVDATAESDASLVKNIARGLQQVVFTGLNSSTTYNFLICPYTNSGDAINYKTSETIPTTSATTDAASASTDYFRSKQSGDWQTAGTWESSSDNSNWINATLAPINTQAKNITIRNDHTVTVSAAPGTLTVDEVTVNTGGQISINATKGLLIAGGAGTDLSINGIVLVNGTLTIQGNATAIVNGTVTQNGSVLLKSGAMLTVNGIIEFNNSATIGDVGNFTLASGGTLITAHANGVNGSIANSGTKTLDAAANYVFNGAVAQTTGVLLTAANSIEIDNATAVDISENITVDALTINAGKVLNIPAAKQLTVSTSMTNDGTLNLKSGVIGTATILPPASINGSGTCNVEQYLGTTRNWYVSSPVSSTTSTTTNIEKYFEYVEAGTNNDRTGQPSGSTAFWKGYIPGHTMVAGKGYIALPSATDATLTFSGDINTDDVTVAITKSGNGYNLIGNPYPSHLTWTEAFVDATSAPVGGTPPSTLIDPTIWIRTNSGSVNSGGDANWTFITYNALVGESVPAWADVVIAPMQSFWVKAKISGDLVFDNTKLSRSHHTSNRLKAPTFKNYDRQRVRLQVNNGTKTDETLIYFDSAASDEYDRYDSPKFAEANTNTQIYSTAGAEKLAINGMNSMLTDTPIKLGFVAGNAAEFSISAVELTNFPEDVKVVLKDNVTLTETDLSDGTACYAFSPLETTEERFSLFFRTAAGATNIKNTFGNSFSAYHYNSKLTVSCDDTEMIGSLVMVYNSIGQLIATEKLTSSTIQLEGAFSQGVYLLVMNTRIIKVAVN